MLFGMELQLFFLLEGRIAYGAFVHGDNWCFFACLFYLGWVGVWVVVYYYVWGHMFIVVGCNCTWGVWAGVLP